MKSVVQIQAIEILARLQDSGDLNDPVIKALMKCLCDRNIQVILHTGSYSALVLNVARF